MFSSLIIFSTTDGHTKKICERIVNFLNNEKLVKIVSLDEATKLDLSEFQKIIIEQQIERFRIREVKELAKLESISLKEQREDYASLQERIEKLKDFNNWIIEQKSKLALASEINTKEIIIE